MKNVSFEKLCEGIQQWVESQENTKNPVDRVSLVLKLSDLHGVTFSEKKYSNERESLKNLIIKINPSFALGYFTKSKKK